MTSEFIPFNRPYMTGKELFYIAEAKFGNKLSGDGLFTKRCHKWLEAQTGAVSALLTHSCTGALEMAALLLNIKPDDEVIMPSFTFVSTANAFVLRGGVPVFVDIREDTLNINEALIESAINEKTKAIVVVHYAGVACEMDSILALANRYGLPVVEDAAQGIMASYKGRSLGSIGDIGTFSFHETKNIISGEGGALILNRSNFVSSAEVIREKGTDRSRFFRGEVDKYTWQGVGSSYLPGEITAAFLWAQLQEAQVITDARLASWAIYHKLLEEMEIQGVLRRPIVPEHCTHNAHMYYVLLKDKIDRQHVLNGLKKLNVDCVFHYIPLHSSPGGHRWGKVSGTLDVTLRQSERLVRLPLWVGISPEQQRRVVSHLASLII